LELDQNAIKLIAENSEFDEVMEKLKQIAQSDHPYVGIDMEENQHATNAGNRVKFLQLAVKDVVYLVKITTENYENYEKLCQLLFAEKALKKLGFNCKNDLKNWPQSVKSKHKEVRDLQKETGPKKLPTGLSDLCKKLLLKPLDKTETCSLWSRQPLRAAQIEYAALDAYCLLMLRDVIDEKESACAGP